MNETEISWTDKTWNPASGCAKVSQGCRFCYAETLAEQKKGMAFPNGFGLTLRPHKLREPFAVKQPSIIFVNSMSDLFWEKIPEEYRDKIIDVIEQTPQHQYQVLTKRPENMLAYSKRRKLPANFWAGVTVENKLYEDRIDVLRKVKANVHFLSLEPLLGPIGDNFAGIDWIITGGESGLHLRDKTVCQKRALVDHGTWKPREDRADWLRSVRDKCLARDIAHFFKQWGGVRPKSGGNLLDGQTWEEFPQAAQALLRSRKLSHLQTAPTTLPLFATA